MNNVVPDLFLTLRPPAPTMQPESSDGFASVGTILPKEEAALLPGGFFRFCGLFSSDPRAVKGLSAPPCPESQADLEDRQSFLCLIPLPRHFSLPEVGPPCHARTKIEPESAKARPEGNDASLVYFLDSTVFCFGRLDCCVYFGSDRARAIVPLEECQRPRTAWPEGGACAISRTQGRASHHNFAGR